MLIAALGGAEMAMRDAGISVVPGSGVGAAEEHWRQSAAAARPVEVGAGPRA
jgi:alanine-glyoxylate transaminase/serine-glyoxylate transaminase/serine-pyruvate transaminase